MDAFRNALAGYELMGATVVLAAVSLAAWVFVMVRQAQQAEEEPDDIQDLDGNLSSANPAARSGHPAPAGDAAAGAGTDPATHPATLAPPEPWPEWSRLIVHRHELHEAVTVEAWLVDDPACFVCLNMHDDGRHWHEAVLLNTSGDSLTITNAPAGFVPQRHAGHELVLIGENSSLALSIAHARSLQAVRDDLIDVTGRHYGEFATRLRLTDEAHKARQQQQRDQREATKAERPVNATQENPVAH